MIFIVNLFEIAILATSDLLPVEGALYFGQLTLMAHKIGISSQVLVSIIRVRLNGLAREVLAEEHHLAHLILSQALCVDVVWIGVRQGLDRRYNFN